MEELKELLKVGVSWGVVRFRLGIRLFYGLFCGCLLVFLVGVVLGWVEDGKACIGRFRMVFFLNR